MTFDSFAWLLLLLKTENNIRF